MSNRRKYYLTSDTHFSHRNILKYCNRPFASADEMDEHFIHNWNKTVTKSDFVYVLGDVIFEKDPVKRDALLSRLNGEKHLIWGNHDKQLKPNNWQKHFHSAVELRTVTLPVMKNGLVTFQEFVLCHYSMRIWDKAHYGAIQFCGHSHSSLPPIKNQLDVGIDNAYILLGEYRPFLLEEAVEFATSYEHNLVATPPKELT